MSLSYRHSKSGGVESFELVKRKRFIMTYGENGTIIPCRCRPIAE